MTLASEPKVAALTISRLAEAAVVGSDGEALGKVADVMIDAADGSIRYVAVAVGGVLGVGERLFAVPWSHLDVTAPGTLRWDATEALLVEHPGFDKDNWPADADAGLFSHPAR